MAELGFDRQNSKMASSIPNLWCKHFVQFSFLCGVEPVSVMEYNSQGLIINQLTLS